MFYDEREQPRVGRITFAVIAAILLVIGLIALLTGMKKTPADHIGLSYGGGPIEGNHYQQTVDPASGIFFNGLFDKLYLYPVTQRNYIVSKSEGEGDRNGVDFIQRPSKDGIPVDFEVATYFKLNTDEVQQFHEQIGLKYQAWTDEGWDRMLNDYIRQQIEESIKSEASRYSAEQLYSDADVLQEVGDKLGNTINQRVINKAGGNYFCQPTWTSGDECGDFTFTIKNVDIANEEVKNALAARRASEIAIGTEQNKVEQAKQQAEAIRVLQQALQLYAGSSSAYVQLEYIKALMQAIKDGDIEFWVLPNNGNITVPGPQR